MPRVLRVLAFGLLAVGLAVLTVSLVSRERVNSSGFVPGVALGYALVTTAGLTLVAGRNLRDRGYLRFGVVSAIAVWIVSSVYLVVWGLEPGSLRDVPMGTILGLVVIGGFLGAQLGAVYMLGLIPVFAALGWILDRIPALRRRGIGKRFRSAIGF